jgi:hypothetical protein
MASDCLAVSSAVEAIVAPEIEYNGALHVLPDDEEEYRDITLCFVGNFAYNPDLAPNKSLGLAAIGRSLESVKAICWSSLPSIPSTKTKSLLGA